MLRLSWAPALCVAALQFWSLALARKAPNMIWIMADDLGWGEVGLYPAESPHGRIATPNLDQFGREGVRFQQAYAGYTVCAPSRTTFFTGRHSGHFRALQLNVISYLDDKVGDVMKQLKALKIDEKTMVFFASDNGAHLEGGHQIAFFNSTGGLSGHKRSMYEGGVRSPTMVRWPQQIRPRTSQFAWAFWDMVPTVAELLGDPTEQRDWAKARPELVDELKRLVMAEGLSCMCYQCGFSDDVMSSVII
eukprot:g31063.t1